MKSSIARNAYLARLTRIGGLLLALSVGTATVISARTATPAQGKVTHPHKAKSSQTPLERSVAELAKQLNLTKDQTDKIRPIITDRIEKQHALRVKYKNDRKTYLAEAQKLREEHVKQIEAVLTPEQVKEYQKILQKQEGKMHRKTRKTASQTSGKASPSGK